MANGAEGGVGLGTGNMLNDAAGEEGMPVMAKRDEGDGFPYSEGCGQSWPTRQTSQLSSHYAPSAPRRAPAKRREERGDGDGLKEVSSLQREARQSTRDRLKRRGGAEYGSDSDLPGGEQLIWVGRMLPDCRLGRS